MFDCPTSSSKQAEKEEFMEKVRKERDKRAEMKAHDSSAVKIQVSVTKFYIDLLICRLVLLCPICITSFTLTSQASARSFLARRRLYKSLRLAIFLSIVVAGEIQFLNFELLVEPNSTSTLLHFRN